MARERRTNLLALPKRPDLWQCFVSPDPDYVIAHWDFASLEPTVLAYMSQDEGMLKIYGDGGQIHDVYLYAAAFFPDMRERVLALYDIDKGFKNDEALDHAKIILKKDRKYTKPVYLGWTYGLGYKRLSFDKQIPLVQAKESLNAIDDAFPGKRRLHNFLVKEWFKNRGWVTNVRGRPITVHKDKLHDIVNRVTQSGGHDLLMRVLFHKLNLIKEMGIDARPYIPNIHDEALLLVHKDHVKKYKIMVDKAFALLNDELDWNIKLKHGGITFGNNCSIRCD